MNFKRLLKYIIKSIGYTFFILNILQLFIFFIDLNDLFNKDIVSAKRISGGWFYYDTNTNEAEIIDYNEIMKELGQNNIIIDKSTFYKFIIYNMIALPIFIGIIIGCMLYIIYNDKYNLKKIIKLYISILILMIFILYGIEVEENYITIMDYYMIFFIWYNIIFILFCTIRWVYKRYLTYKLNKELN